MKINALKSAVLSLLCLGSLAIHARADVIVDTGTPDDSTPWSFANWQYFGAEFNVTQDTVISSVEGYFSNQWGTAGNVTFALHADNSYNPGAVLYSSALAMGGSDPLSWYGVFGLNWSIAAGTYWVSFMPDSNIAGTMPDAAPNPLAQYSQASGNYGWQANYANAWDHLHLGVRINGDAAGVPDHGSIALIWGLVGLVGILAHRRQRRA
ncbi:hypothetical protein ESB00_05500 [Oleiharenicola lentus]|jgi:MYXO-CTERM domain-containing protein|uniref:VPDSG-CTERM sorting domain-containing protein n=1 Tax=Oleiharenicola lentus TaxID=2508720 RepID=A0A4Q1C8R5_9BACT|nr:hypothetical protein [Oleiharenicola lentus]RXK55353.1 hypothetical protein ESB00_05500 [Oleiharenicola lentus]